MSETIVLLSPEELATINARLDALEALHVVLGPAPEPVPIPEPPLLVSIEITSLSRDVGSTSGGTVLEIVGEGFVPGMVVLFGGVTAALVMNSGTSLTVTVPAHVVGLVDVAVGPATLANGFEYLSAPTTTYISHDFEDGTLGEFTTNFNPPVVGEWGHSVSGTFSVKASKSNSGSGGSKLVHSRAGLTPTNPPLEPTGVYQRWYQIMPQDSLDAAASGQIKILLNRGGPGAWLMGILGAQAGSGSGGLDEVVMLQDEDTGILPPSTGFVVKADNRASESASRTGFRIQADEPVEFQTWFYHDGTHGRARLWINGKEMFDVLGGTETRNSPPCDCLGTPDATGVYDWELGVVWVQANTTAFDAVVYLDEVAMANGFIEPIQEG